MYRVKKMDKYCQQPDRHEPKLKCGYPMPCIHHSVFVVIKDKTKNNKKKKK